MIFRPKYHLRIIQFADFITSLFGFGLSYYIWSLLHIIEPKDIPTPFGLSSRHITLWILLSLLYVFLFKYVKAYSYQRFRSLKTEYINIIKVSLISSSILIIYSFLLREKELSRSIVIISFITNLILFIIQKTILFYFAAFLRKSGKNRKKVLLIGTGTRAKKFIETVENNFKWGLDIIGLLSSDPEKVNKEFFGYKVLGEVKDIEKILKEKNPEEVIFTISTKRFETFRECFEVCEREGVTIRLNSDFFGKITKNVQVNNIYGLNIISFMSVPEKEFQGYLKRIIDIICSLIAIILFSPFMIVAIVGIWITDGRPIIYRWNVIGKDKKPFKSWKFRTMVKNADSLKYELLSKNEMIGPVFKIKNDPRILPFGRWLRKFSIDETPQLFSVLKGDMSLVGPRPAGPTELLNYKSWHRRRLSVKPGLTCLWQVNGRNEIKSFDEWVKLDLYYIDNWSLWLDIKILLKTIPIIINGKGAS